MAFLVINVYEIEIHNKSKIKLEPENQITSNFGIPRKVTMYES